MKKKAN